MHPDGGSRDLQSSHRGSWPWFTVAWSQSISVLSTSETELAESVWQGSGDKALLNPGTRVPFPSSHWEGL